MAVIVYYYWSMVVSQLTKLELCKRLTKSHPNVLKIALLPWALPQQNTKFY